MQGLAIRLVFFATISSYDTRLHHLELSAGVPGFGVRYRIVFPRGRIPGRKMPGERELVGAIREVILEICADEIFQSGFLSASDLHEYRKSASI